MAKFIHVGDKLVNLDSIDYVDLNYGTEREMIIHFRGSERTLSVGGDDAEELKEYLASEQIFERTGLK
mgnify:CR=1 FL=1